ncbi:MAG: OmpA family protein [Ignavibacteria bacterium]|nr:OmpA family protein [Ignavibacteria bacterium]
MKKFKVVFLFIFLSIFDLQSQSKLEPIFHYGAELNLGLNIHFVDFNKLENIPNCCPKYTNTLGLGWNIALILQKDFLKDFAIRLRAGFNSEGVTFKEKEFIGNTSVKYVDDPTKIILVPVTVEHLLNPKILGIYLEPVGMYNLYDRFWLNLGINFSNFILTKVNQKEVIVSPENIVFIDGKKERNEYFDLDIPEVKKFQIRPTIGFSYDIILFKDAFISPEIRYAIPIQNISNVEWKLSYLNFGFSARFPVYPPPEIRNYYDTTYYRDTSLVAVLGLKSERIALVETKILETKKERIADGYLFTTIISEKYKREVPKISQLVTDIKAIGKSRTGELQENPTLIIEEIETEEMFPLLPHIYFPTGEWDLNKTNMVLFSKNEAKNFDENSLSWNTLRIYDNLLNIVGSRLKKNSKENIVLIGCNSNTGVEANNLELSRKRVEAVRDYLVNVWDIDPKRITIRVRNLPEKMTNPTIPEGIEENQRVEIVSKDWSILKPVRLSQIQRTSNPPIVELFPSIISDSPIKGWNLSIQQGGKILREFNASDFPSKITWNVEEEPIPRLEEPVKISFSVVDILDQKSVSNLSIKIEQKTIKKKREELLGDKKIERFSLIVFDFDKAEILPQHIPILNEIKKKIFPNSKVIISGYTDKIGEATYNKELALRRCLAVKNFLGLPDTQVSLNAVGNEILLFDNDIPQGRSYCRTVQITIETPVSKK